MKQKTKSYKGQCEICGEPIAPAATESRFRVNVGLHNLHVHKIKGASASSRHRRMRLGKQNPLPETLETWEKAVGLRGWGGVEPSFNSGACALEGPGLSVAFDATLMPQMLCALAFALGKRKEAK